MRKFEEPKLSVEVLNLEDVIATSQEDVCTDYDCGDDWGTGGF